MSTMQEGSPRRPVIRNGNIGEPQKHIELEPIPENEPIQEPSPQVPEKVPTEPEKVPAGHG